MICFKPDIPSAAQVVYAPLPSVLQQYGVAPLPQALVWETVVGEGLGGGGGGGGGGGAGDFGPLPGIGDARTPVATNAIMVKYFVKCIFAWSLGLLSMFVK